MNWFDSPCKGSDVMDIIGSMRKEVEHTLPHDVKVMVSYVGKKLNICFNVKDKTVFNHEHEHGFLEVPIQMSFNFIYVAVTPFHV